MQLSATVVLALLVAVGFVCGALLSAIISLMVGSAKMRRKAKEEEMRQGVMDGLSRSCDGIESAIAAVDTTSINAGVLRSEVLKRIGALDRRLGQYADTLDKYYIAYITLRLESYRQLVTKLDSLVADIARYGGAVPAPSEEDTGVPAEAEQAPVEAAPAPLPAMPSLEMPPEAPVAEAAPEPVAPDVDVGATMSFDAMGMQGAGAGGEQPVMFGGAIEEPPAQPEAPPQPEAQAPEAAAAPGLTDDDVMYGQTMQFSMTDIEAARRREAAGQLAPEPVAPEPEVPVAEQPEPQQPSPFSPAVSGDMGETIVFAVDDTSGPAVEEPQAAPAVEMPAEDAAPAEEQAAPPEPQAGQAKDGKAQGQGGMITGNDLMEQMDAFFNFNQ